jgi:hypothetical protein
MEVDHQVVTSSMKMEQAVPNGNETGPEESNHILYVL